MVQTLKQRRRRKLKIPETDLGLSIPYLLHANFDAVDQGYADAQILDMLTEGVQNGQLMVKEADGTLAIVSNECVITAQSSPTWGDLGFYSQAITRILGKGVLIKVDKTSARMGVFWSPSGSVTTPAAAGTLGFYHGSGVAFQVIDAGFGPVVDPGISTGTDYIFAIVLGGYDTNGIPYFAGQAKSNYLYGGTVFIKGGAYTTWTKLWSVSTVNTSPLYVVLSTFDFAGNVDNIRIPDVDLTAVQAAITNLSTFTAVNGTSLDAITPEVGGVWTEQSGAWDIQSNRANPDGAAIATVDPSIADVVLDCVVNGGAGDQPAIVIRFSDTSNYWYLQADRANNQLELHEYNATVDNVRANTAITIDDSTDYTLRVVAEGQKIYGFLDGSNVINYTGAALNENATVHGIRAENTAGRFDNFTLFPRTSSIYDDVLDKV